MVSYQHPVELDYQEHVYEATADNVSQPNLPSKEFGFNNKEIIISIEVRYIQRNGKIVSIPKLGALGRQKKSRNLFALIEEEKKNK